MLNNGSVKIALVITAVVGMLVGSIGLTVGIMNDRENTTSKALSINVSRKLESVIETQQATSSRLLVLETNYIHIIALLEKIEAKIEE